MTTRFVAEMEDVLGVYQRPYDASRPLVRFDEKAKDPTRSWRTANDQRVAIPSFTTGSSCDSIVIVM